MEDISSAGFHIAEFVEGLAARLEVEKDAGVGMGRGGVQREVDFAEMGAFVVVGFEGFAAKGGHLGWCLVSEEALDQGNLEPFG